MILYFVCKEIQWVFQHLLFLYTCHMLSIPQSLYDLSIDITSLPLNLTISFRAVLNKFMVFRHLKKRHLLFMETIMLSWKFLRPITLVRAPMFLVITMYLACPVRVEESRRRT